MRANTEDGRLTARSLRFHQTELLAVVCAIAAGGAARVRDIFAAVTPSGGKSLLPVLAAQALIAAGICEWISSTIRKLSGKRKLSHTAWLMISAGKRYPAKLGWAARAVIRPDYLVAGHSGKLEAGQVDCTSYTRRL